MLCCGHGHVAVLCCAHGHAVAVAVLCAAYHLPVQLPAHLTVQQLMEKLAIDKKNKDSKIKVMGVSVWLG